MGRVEQLKEVSEKMGWKMFFLDIDDTVIPSSNKIWKPAFAYYAAVVSHMTGIPVPEVKRILEDKNNMMYRNPERGVHPSKYQKVARLVEEGLEIESGITRAVMKMTVNQIYTATPPITPEAEEAMATIQECGLGVAFVSHSSEGRLKRFRQAWGLPDNIRMYGWTTLERKGVGVWNKAKKGENVDGEQAVAVDDNVNSCQAARQAGIRTVVWLKPKWDEYADGDDEGLIHLEHLGLLFPALHGMYCG